MASISKIQVNGETYDIKGGVVTGSIAYGETLRWTGACGLIVIGDDLGEILVAAFAGGSRDIFREYIGEEITLEDEVYEFTANSAYDYHLIGGTLID